MTRIRRRFHTWTPGLAALAIVLVLTGCFNPFRPRILGAGISTPPPVPNSPANVLRLLEWCYKNRDPIPYREVFTDDYRFVFSALDPSGNAYRGDTWTREDELISVTKLFQGGEANQPAASSINLNLDRNPVVLNDPRPGKPPPWHISIRTSVILNIEAQGVRTDVTGSVLFYLVRGDSALIPQELLDRGFGPDPNRWYIERWEDETTVPVSSSPGRSSPTPGPVDRARYAGAAGLPPQLTWGGLKVIYRR
jgi:hypothetical protein